MKQLIIICHGKTDPQGNIVANQIENIQEKGIPGVNEIARCYGKIFLHHGSRFARTRQTINAYEVYLLSKGKSQSQLGILLSDPRFGNETILKPFQDPSLKNIAETSSWYTVFEDSRPDFIINNQILMERGVKQIFASIPDEALAITVGHSPLIEWLAIHFSGGNKIPRDLKLKELEGFILTYEAGQIKVTDSVGFTLLAAQPVKAATSL